MELLDGFMECGRRIIPQHILKPSKSTAGSFEQFRGSLLIADRIFHKIQQPPDLSGFIPVKGLSIPGMHQRQGLPVRIAALFQNNLTQIGCQIHKILHQLLGVRKCRLADALQHKPDTAVAADAVGFIDMALTVPLYALNRSRKGIGTHHRLYSSGDFT